MGGQLPLWLGPLLVASLRQIGATASDHDLEAEADFILGEWDQEQRIFFNSRYLALLFERLNELEGATPDPSILRLAAAYYGASHDPAATFLGAKSGGNSAQDGLAVAQRLTRLGVPSGEASRVTELVGVLATPNLPIGDLDAQILLDSNLAVLAVSPQAYAKLCRNLRQYSTLDDERFLRARRDRITTILARGRLFLTPFAAHWSAAVRENLEGELSQIDSRLAAIESDAGSPPAAPAEESKTAVHSGPIVIRSSHSKKLSQTSVGPVRRSVRDAGAAVSPAVSAAVSPAATSGPGSTGAEDAAETVPTRRDLDETSTLESIDDPFSHRKSRRD